VLLFFPTFRGLWRTNSRSRFPSSRRLTAPADSFLAGHCDLKTVDHQTPSDVLDRSGTAIKSFGDPPICPIGAANIRFQQDLRSPHLSRRSFHFLHHLPQSCAFRVSQPDNMSLAHGDTVGKKMTILFCRHVAAVAGMSSRIYCLTLGPIVWQYGSFAFTCTYVSY
jgi:hypothetical protein